MDTEAAVGIEWVAPEVVHALPQRTDADATIGVPVHDRRMESLDSGDAVSDGDEQHGESSTARLGTCCFRMSWSVRADWFASVRSGDIAALRSKIASGVVRNVNVRGDWGKTALYLSVEAHHEPAVKLLIEAAADVNLRDRGLNNDTPLHVAAYRGSANIMRHLLRAGADINAVNLLSRSPLDLASQKDREQNSSGKELCVELLTGWATAVMGEPVQIRTAEAESQDVYYFSSCVAECHGAAQPQVEA